MAYATEFKRELEELFDLRTEWLVDLLQEEDVEKPSRLSKTEVRATIENLKDIISDALADRLATQYFEENVAEHKGWKNSPGKGRTFEDRKDNFKEWFHSNFETDTYVYVFWGEGKECIYVGRTEAGKGRASSHFDKIWFPKTRWIDIYTTRGNRPLAAMECLAQHRWQPSRSKVKAAAKKWTDKCPLCARHRLVADEIEHLFG